MRTNHLFYDGRISKLYQIWIKNLLLGILTLGIYRPWGKTNYRIYVYHSFKIGNDRLIYTGTGGELLRGMIKANMLIFLLFIVLYIPLVIVFGAAPEQDLDAESTAEFISNLSILPAFLILLFIARFSALRYRLGRTKWRGIRGSLRGKLWNYVGFRLGRFAINCLTLGFALGRSAILDNKKLLNQAYFGDKKFDYDADNKMLDAINAVTLLLALPTLGFSRFWFKAARLNAKYNNLKIGNIRFNSYFTATELLLLSLGNWLILIFTLFIGKPVVIQRITRHFYCHIEIVGDIDEFKQQPLKLGSNFGEGVTDYFDSDGIDLDFGII